VLLIGLAECQAQIVSEAHLQPVQCVARLLSVGCCATGFKITDLTIIDVSQSVKDFYRHLYHDIARFETI
jgi:hypothetical protein